MPYTKAKATPSMPARTTWARACRLKSSPSRWAPTSWLSQHSLGSVAEGQEVQSVAADGYGGRHPLHLPVVGALGADLLADPAVGDARSVDAQQYADPGVRAGVVDVGEAVDPLVGVVGELVRHPVHYPNVPPVAATSPGAVTFRLSALLGWSPAR